MRDCWLVSDKHSFYWVTWIHLIKSQLKIYDLLHVENYAANRIQIINMAESIIVTPNSEEAGNVAQGIILIKVKMTNDFWVVFIGQYHFAVYLLQVLGDMTGLNRFKTRFLGHKIAFGN